MPCTVPFWKIPKLAICKISVALSINFDNEENFQGSKKWGKKIPAGLENILFFRLYRKLTLLFYFIEANSKRQIYFYFGRESAHISKFTVLLIFDLL